MTTEGKSEAVQADPWMTLPDAAEALGEARQTVLTRTVKGELEAKHEAGRTLISRASVEKLLADRAA